MSLKEHIYEFIDLHNEQMELEYKLDKIRHERKQLAGKLIMQHKIPELCIIRHHSETYHLIADVDEAEDIWIMMR
jgi:hypothetical protein